MSSATTTGTWSSWCYGNTGTSNTSDNSTWSTWATSSSTGFVYTGTISTEELIWNTWAPGVKTDTQTNHHPTGETAEERQAREAREAESERIRTEDCRKAEEQRKQAEEKAFTLLLDNLEENQAEIFKKTGCFVVIGQSGNKYRIRKGRLINVDVMEGESVKHKLCFHPSEYCPDYDVMLAQKLMLEHDEQAALRIANVH